jgi:predicted metalloprotease with PDZ domain
MFRFVLSAGLVALMISALTWAAQDREQQPKQAPPVRPQVGQKALTPDNDAPATKKAPAERKAHHRRVYLGVYTVPVEDLSSRSRKKLKLENTEGVIVVDVMPDSPADEAGLRHGDVILRVNGKEVDDEDELSKDLKQVGPGKSVNLAIIRDGKKQEIKAELQEAQPGDFRAHGNHDNEMDEMLGMCQQNTQRIERLERKIARLEKRLAEMGKTTSVKERE